MSTCEVQMVKCIKFKNVLFITMQNERQKAITSLPHSDSDSQTQSKVISNIFKIPCAVESWPYFYAMGAVEIRAHEILLVISTYLIFT